MTPEDIWLRVDRSDPEACWLVNEAGRYGRVYVDGHFTSAHRIAYELAHGRIAPGLHVCHHCDHPACINPSHLFMGTAVDNHRDAMEKGRVPLAEAHPQAKLGREDVEAIRALLATGWSRAALAFGFQVSKTTILRIANGSIWSGA
jgi:hypothetical protein